MRLKDSAALLVLAAFILLSNPAGAAPPLPHGDEIRVSLLENVAHSNPQVAVFPDGGFVVVWTVGPHASQGRSVIHARFFDQDGTPAGGEFRLVDRFGDSQVVDHMVADRDGSFLVAWTERAGQKSKVFVRRFHRDGTPWGKRVQANAPSKSSRYKAVLAVGADGRFAVAWRAWVDLEPVLRSYTNTVARIFSAKGDPLTNEFVVGRGAPGGDGNTDSGPVAVGVGPDGSVSVQRQDVAPSDSYKNYLHRYDPQGRPKKSYALSSPLSCCLDSPGASLGMGRDGSLIAAWNWGSQIVAQRFTAKGDPRGEAFRVSGAQEFFIQEHPLVTVVSGGTSVIIWIEDEHDGDGYGLFGRVYSNAGTPLSNDFQINTTTQGWQYQAAIASSPGGPTVVVWLSSERGGSDIFARLLTSEP